MAVSKAVSEAVKPTERTYHGAQYTYDESEAGKEKRSCFFCLLYDHDTIVPTDFGYFVTPRTQQRLSEGTQTVENLLALGEAMVDSDNEPSGDSTVPAGYTYWGQFLDHDITAATDRKPVFDLAKPADQVEAIDPVLVTSQVLMNERTPFLDLDSVYGSAQGPFSTVNPALRRMYQQDDPAKLRIGTVAQDGDIDGDVPDPDLGFERDLPRNTDQAFLPDRAETIAVIGDLRNDENLVIAQFHLAWLKFHNAVVDALREEARSGWKPACPLGVKDVFREARREVGWHHQWLTVEDYLRTVCGHEAVDDALERPSLYKSLAYDDPNCEAYACCFMPLEFSVAAYRFGHSMVRNNYDFNLNFGREAEVLPSAGFDLLFLFTGGGAAGGGAPGFSTALPFNWIIEWDRFFFDPAHSAAPSPSSGEPSRFARKFDTRLAVPLSNMANESFDGLSDEQKQAANDVGVQESRFNEIMKHLAKRNLLRGYVLSLPTAQAMMTEWGMQADLLTHGELQQGNSAATNQALQDGGFLDATPLWYYVLKEAEVRGEGNRLGPLGGAIVARTLIGLLKCDPNSYLNVEGGWTPDYGIVRGATGRRVTGIRDVLRFAGVMA